MQERCRHCCKPCRFLSSPLLLVFLSVRLGWSVGVVCSQVRGEIAGLLALSLYAVSPLVRLLTQSITTFVRLEVQMVSVERIRDYLLVLGLGTQLRRATRDRYLGMGRQTGDTQTSASDGILFRVVFSAFLSPVVQLTACPHMSRRCLQTLSCALRLSSSAGTS